MTKFVNPSFSVQLAQESKQDRERRLFPRYSIVGTVEIWESGYKFSTRGTVTDISMSGCYVQMLNPLTTGQKLRCKLTLGKNTCEADAVVVNHHPSLGMGIDFENLTAEQQSQLSACIQYAVDKQTSHETSTEQPLDGSPETTTGRAATLVSKMQEWFLDHDLMTRDEYRKLLDRVSAESKDKFFV